MRSCRVPPPRQQRAPQRQNHESPSVSIVPVLLPALPSLSVFLHPHVGSGGGHYSVEAIDSIALFSRRLLCKINRPQLAKWSLVGR